MEPSQTVAARDARPATGVPDGKGRHVRYHPRSTQRSEVFWKMEGALLLLLLLMMMMMMMISVVFSCLFDCVST